MVFEIECSDEQCEHVELKSDGTARLFGRGNYDEENGAFTISARQLKILLAMIDAKSKLAEALR